MGGTVRTKVADRPWTWAVAAALAAAVTAAMLVGLWADTARTVALELGVAGLFAVPLLLRRRPKLFAAVCLFVGCFTLPAAALIALMGAVVFLPAPVMLLVAAFADSRNSPWVGWVVLALGASAVVTRALMTL